MKHPNRATSIVTNIAVPVLATLAVNGAILGLDLAQDNRASDAVPFAPPGWVIGLVWTLLFVLFGIARWRLQRHSIIATKWLTIFMIWCLAYPLTSAGFAPPQGQLVNIVSLLFGAFVTSYAWRADRTAGMLLVPGLIWMSFAVVLGAAILQSTAATL